jgi:hypothetical protein
MLLTSDRGGSASAGEDFLPAPYSRVGCFPNLIPLPRCAARTAHHAWPKNMIGSAVTAVLCAEPEL